MSDPVPCREQIVVRALQRLQAISGVVAVRERRDLLTAAELEASPYLILFEGADTDATVYTMEDGYNLPLTVQGVVKGNGAESSTALNALRAKVQMALCPASDRTLGGLARWIEIDDTGDELVTGIATDQFKGFVLEASVQYATAEGDPFTFA
jgi:hypothetical protein